MPITKAEVAELVALNLTRRQIAEKIGCSPSYIQRMIDKYSIPAIRRECVPIEDVRKLVVAGHTLSEIHAVVGFSRAAVHKAMQQVGGYRKLLNKIPPQIRNRMFKMSQRGVYYRHIAAIFGYSVKQVNDCMYRYYGGKIFAVKGTRKGKPPSEERISIWAELSRKRLIARYRYPDLAANAVALAAVSIQEYPDGPGVPSLFWRIASARMVDEIRKERGDSRATKWGSRKIKTEEMVEEHGELHTEPEYFADELDILRQKISTLPDRLRKFGYTYLECGCDKGETGKRLGLSESSVFRTWNELLNELRVSYGIVGD